MKIVPPLAILDAVLSSSNVVETAPAAYNGATVYGAGATVSVATGTALAVYTSLFLGNVGNAPASSPSFWAHTGDTYALYNIATTYAANDIVLVVGADNHQLYQSIAGGNVGNAVTDATKWLALGASNCWKMFDGSVTSQTVNPGSITDSFIIPGRADTVAFLNVNAAAIRVTMTDVPTSTVVWDRGYSMISTDGIYDGYTYCFAAIDRLADLVVSGLPNYANARVDVVISDIALIVTPIGGGGGTGGYGVLDFSDPSESGLLGAI